MSLSVPNKQHTVNVTHVCPTWPPVRRDGKHHMSAWLLALQSVTLVSPAHLVQDRLRGRRSLTHECQPC